MCNGLLPRAGWLFAEVTKTHGLCAFPKNVDYDIIFPVDQYDNLEESEQV